MCFTRAVTFDFTKDWLLKLVRAQHENYPVIESPDPISYSPDGSSKSLFGVASPVLSLGEARQLQNLVSSAALVPHTVLPLA